MTFVVDGLPISDQLTGAFANALDGGVVQTAELCDREHPGGVRQQGVGRRRPEQPQRRRRPGALHRRSLGRRRRLRHGQGSRPGRRRARARRLLRLGRPRCDRSLPRSGVARQPAQRRALRRAPSAASTCASTIATQLRVHVMGGGSRSSSRTCARSRPPVRISGRSLNDVAVWSRYTADARAASTLERPPATATTTADLRPAPATRQSPRPRTVVCRRTP